MISYLMGYVAAREGGAGGEFILEGGPWEDRRARLFPTREKAARAGRKHGYTYTRGYVYLTDFPLHAKGLKRLDEVEDTGVVPI